MTIYAVGDIHGHLDKLERVHAWIDDDRDEYGAKDAPLVHVGDLIDRGPHSAGVVEYLRGMRAQDPRVVVLRGNHDQYFIDYLTMDLATLEGNGCVRWTEKMIGGRETLTSYGVRRMRRHIAHKNARDIIPRSHLDFMKSLPFMYETEDCLFVHAGIKPGVPFADQDPDNLMWIRDEFLLSREDHGKLVVHGHTPSEEVELFDNRLGIDTGAAYGGPLSAVVIEGREVSLLTKNGRVRIT